MRWLHCFDSSEEMTNFSLLFISFFTQEEMIHTDTHVKKTLCGDVTVGKGRGQVGSHVQGTIYLLNIETGGR